MAIDQVLRVPLDRNKKGMTAKLKSLYNSVGSVRYDFEWADHVRN